MLDTDPKWERVGGASPRAKAALKGAIRQIIERAKNRMGEL
jgi:hypothetical protein